MTLLITAALAAVEGALWWLLADGQRMPYWLMVALTVAALFAADVIERERIRRRARQRSARRAAITRRWNNPRPAVSRVKAVCTTCKPPDEESYERPETNGYSIPPRTP